MKRITLIFLSLVMLMTCGLSACGTRQETEATETSTVSGTVGEAQAPTDPRKTLELPENHDYGNTVIRILGATDGGVTLLTYFDVDRMGYSVIRQ